MVKIFNPLTFTINIASKPKRELKSKSNNISRKCLAVVKEINGEFKAIVNIDKKHIYIKDGDELSNEQLILPFTDKSLDLRNKTYVWFKEKDKYGHNVCIIRDSATSRLHPGVPGQYLAVKENLLISGYIIRKDGKMYFEYEDLVKYNYLSETLVNNIKIDNTKPLFNK